MSKERTEAPWLVELIGPQHSGKSTIADMLATTLEENGRRTARIETDYFVYNVFPAYTRLKVTGDFERAHKFMHGRWNLLHSIIADAIRDSLAAGYVAIHDHVNTRPFRKGVYRALAEEGKANYLSVWVGAPLDELKRRWRSAGIPEAKVAELEEKHSKFTKLREECAFDVVIDTSTTPHREAVLMIISKISPGLRPSSLPEGATEVVEAHVARADRPRKVVGGIQVLEQGGAYFVVAGHRRFFSDRLGLRILGLCDGTRSLEEIARLAGTDIETAKKDVEFLCKSEIVNMVPGEVTARPQVRLASAKISSEAAPEER